MSSRIHIPESEYQISSIRSQGAGGQNVNKVASAVHLRFDINSSSLPARCKQRLLTSKDRRINNDGFVVIKAQRFRTREKNKLDAIGRLHFMIENAMRNRKKRIATQPTRTSIEKRLDEKSSRKKVKTRRRKPDLDE